MGESAERKINKQQKKEKKAMTDADFRVLVDSVEELIGKEIPDKKNISTQDFLDFVRDSALDEHGSGELSRASYKDLEERARKELEQKQAEEAKIEKARQEVLKKTTLSQIVARVSGESLKVDIKEEECLSKERIPSGEDYLKFLETSGTPEHQLAYRKVLDICKIIGEAGGKALLVGGSVRDMFMGKIPKDFDLEVYKLPDQSLKDLLTVASRELGGGIKTDVGKAFGITKVAFKVPKQFEGESDEEQASRQIDLDISIPRSESKSGVGHKDFKVVLHPEMTIKEAARRRDFTMNSVAADPLTGEVYDWFGGIANIKKRELRVTDEERFKDDPLRVLRAVQFIGRYAMSVDRETARIIEETTPGLKHISKERFGEEWDKLLTKSPEPSHGLIAGILLGVFDEAYPEFVKLAETLQEFEWHPEGDVWVHTLMAVDEAARLARRENLTQEDTKVLLYTALLHDLGKIPTTKFDETKGRITSIAHDRAGVQLAEAFLDKIGASKDVKDKVMALVGDHLAPQMMYIQFVLKNENGKKDPRGAVRRLAKRIYPATIKLLALTGESDHLGRGPFINRVDTDAPASEKDVADFALGQMKDETAVEIDKVFRFAMPQDYPAGKWLLDVARDLKVEESKPADVITGKLLIEAGYKPGILFGELIRLANDLRDEIGDKYDSSDKVFAELVEWRDGDNPHPALIRDLNVAKEKLEKILNDHRSKPAV